MPILKFLQPPPATYPRTFTPHIYTVGVRDHDGDGPLAPKARGLKLSGPTPTPGGPPDQIPLVSVDTPIAVLAYPNASGQASEFAPLGDLAVDLNFGAHALALGDNEFMLWYVRENGGWDLDPDNSSGSNGYFSIFFQRGEYSPGTDSTVLDDPILAFGGRSDVDAVPPFTDPGDVFTTWTISESGGNGVVYPQVLVIDRNHVLFRFFDEYGNTNSRTYGDGSFSQEVVCVLLTVDWENGTINYGPFNFILDPELSGGHNRVYEYQWASFSDRMQRLPDGRFFIATQDWNYSAVVCRVGRLDMDTGLTAWGPQWHHPDSHTFGNYEWVNYNTPSMTSWVIDATTVAIWWQVPDSASVSNGWKIAIFTIEDDDSVTLTDWAYTYPPPGYDGMDNFGDVAYWDMTQPQPGQFVTFTDISSAHNFDNDLFVFDVQTISSNVGYWQRPLAPFAYVDPIYEGYRGDPYDYPENQRLVTVSNDGAFVASWHDHTDVFDNGTFFGPYLHYVCSFELYPEGGMNKGFQSVIAGIPNRNAIPGSWVEDYVAGDNRLTTPSRGCVVHSSTNLDLAVLPTYYGVDNNVVDSDYQEALYVMVVKLLPSC